MKKWGIAFLFLILCCIPIASIYAKQNSQVIYRVYVEDQMIGVLSDISIYEQYKEQKLKSYLETYELEELIIPDSVRIEQEVTFIPYTPRDEEIISYIDENVKFKIKGYYVKVGSSNMCVKDVSDVEKEIAALLQLFVTEDELKRVQDTGNPIEPLTTEGEQVIGIAFNPKLEYSKSVCNVDDIPSGQQIGNLILMGEKEPVKVGILGTDMTMESLAASHNLDFNEFKLLNYRVLSNRAIPYVGQQFNLTPLSQSVQVEVEKEVVKQEVIEYETETIEDPNLPVGEIQTRQEGYNGVKLTSYKETYVNGQRVSKLKMSESVLNEAQNRIIVKGTKEIPSRGTKDWKWPTTRYNISCAYLCYSGHYALDISAYVGQPVYAADNGVIIQAGWNGAYGYSILINHNNGYYTRYAHLSKVDVSVGPIVAGGQEIGKAGNTGNSTGPHLHFEIRTNTGSQPSYAPNPASFY